MRRFIVSGLFVALLAMPTQAAAVPPTCLDGTVVNVFAGEPYLLPPAPCMDADGDTLSIIVVDGPHHGTLDTTSRTYTADAAYEGPDTIQFKANDGTSDSNVATVTITVTQRNVKCSNFAVTATAGQPLALPPFPCTDKEGDPLGVGIVDAADHGTLNPPGIAPIGQQRTYTAEPSYQGLDTIKFVAGDATNNFSNVATLTITVVQPAPAIHCLDGTAGTTFSGQAVTLPAAPCTDPQGDPLTIVIVKGPDHGTLSPAGDAPIGPRTYTPSPGYIGTDTIQFKATDGTSESNVATFTMTILPAPVQSTGTTSTTQSASSAAAPAPAATTTAPAVDGRPTAPSGVRLSGNRLILSMRCDPRSTVACRGTVRVLPASGTAVLATSTFRAAPAQRVTLRLALTKAGRKRLARRRTVRLRVVTTTKDARGRKVVTTSVITLRGRR